MIIEQMQWTRPLGWRTIGPSMSKKDAGLVLAFGAGELLEDPARFAEIRANYPEARIVCCSTSGEILGASVWDNSISLTAIAFNATTLAVSSLNIAAHPNSFQAGRALIGNLPLDGLAHVFVLSDGQRVNGSELVLGLRSMLPADIPITGGMAGDGTRFQRTFVGLDVAPAEGNVVAVGFYGDALNVGYGSMGGWDSFGPDRVITRSAGNVLYELDGQSALGLYKKYLGDLASELPGSALHFPLSIRQYDDDSPVVRTILSISEEDDSMTFAGDMPEGAYARLMKANFDRLIDGASIAAGETRVNAAAGAELAILISCVGRKVVLAQRTEEEVEAVREVLGENTVLAGFYSYGEISPFGVMTRCQLHNQTMTITTFSEK